MSVSLNKWRLVKICSMLGLAALACARCCACWPAHALLRFQGRACTCSNTSLRRQWHFASRHTNTHTHTHTMHVHPHTQSNSKRLSLSRDDRASGTGREGTRRAWTAGLGRIGCERPCSGLLPSRLPHLPLGLHLLPRAPATRTRKSWWVALAAPRTRRRGPSSTTTIMRCAPATVGSS